MKFLLVKDLKKDQYFKPILTGLLFFTLLYLISDIFVKNGSLGVSITTLQNTLFGNEEEYIEPMEVSVFLELWHIEIFFLMMVLLVLSAVFIRLCGHSKRNIIITNITLLAALSSLISLAAGFFYLPDLLYIYLGGFYIWHLGALYMSLISIKRFYVK